MRARRLCAAVQRRAPRSIARGHQPAAAAARSQSLPRRIQMGLQLELQGGGPRYLGKGAAHA